MIGALRKLKGRSFRELRERSVSAIYAAAEAAGFDLVTGHIPAELSIRKGACSILVPSGNSMVSSSDDRFTTTGEAEGIVTSADRVIEGKFDLLGYEGLDFGGSNPDWHLDPVSGRRSPKVHWTRINEIDAKQTGDKKVIWELNRHQYFIQLAQAYRFTQAAKYLDALAAHFDSWCEANPPKTGVNWLSSLELAYRAISWINTYSLLEYTELFRGERLDRLNKLLYIHARHIERFLSTYFAPNTHLTGEALGLYYIGTFLEAGDHSERWREIGFNILCQQVSKHIRDDGSYVEQASHYARYTADLYSDLVLIRRREGLGVPEEMIARLSLLQDYLEALIRPDGSLIIFGDDDGGRFFAADPHPITEICPTLARLSIVTGKALPEGLIDTERAIGSLFWTVSEAELEAFFRTKTIAAPAIRRSFPDGGVFIHRTAAEPNADHFLFQAGPHGFLNCGHAHADALSFELCVGGSQVFADPGTYVYTADPLLRNLFRSSEYHTSLLVNGESMSVPAGPFSWKSSTNTRLLRVESSDDRMSLCAETDGFEMLGVEFSRSVELEAGRQLEIIDEINSRSVNSFQLRFILAPDVEPRLMGDSVALHIGSIENTLVLTGRCKIEAENIVDQPEWSVEDIHFSPIYGKLMATKALNLRFRADGSIRLRTVFCWD
jgi:hypothetical protein